MTNLQTRRTFLNHSSKLLAGTAMGSLVASDLLAEKKKAPLFKISCTEYSLHRMIGKGDLDNLDYAAYIRKHFDIDAVEYWNRPFFDKGGDEKYVADMRKRADDAGVGATAILVDGEGNLGDPDEAKRIDAVNRHKRWVTAAKQLGCHSIRVNASSKGSYEEQQKLAADGLRRLSEFGKEHGQNIIVENHGGFSSNGEWLAGVMKMVGLPNCGTLPDFGNFHDYDRYKGTKELMPYAKLVSAKSHDFDEKGNETRTDYMKIMKIVLDAGYHDYVGIEYEGGRLSEVEGIKATKKLLERVRDELA
ncbi:MAG: L-ribulose-5-phosphate 3-epimerase [Kiritimatiellia bacterium]|jgi:L-ribulose-5-phosphate 3-epimerase